MTERPIIFSAPMVRAVLAGTKTQTRRVIQPQPIHAQRYEWRGRVLYDAEHRIWWWRDKSFENLIDFEDGRRELAASCPYGCPGGDRLWVREHYYVAEVAGQGSGRGFVIFDDEWSDREPAPRVLRPIVGQQFGSHAAFHLPRWASRILLEVTAVRVQRVQEIDARDAEAEGVEPQRALGDAVRSFATLWDSINGKRPGCDWASNPFVWVVEFRRAE